MKTFLCLIALLFASGRICAADNSAPNVATSTGGDTGPTAETVLANQVSEIAAATKMTLKTKDRLISSAVRLAINAAIQGIKDQAQILEIAMDLTTAAAKAAPKFANTILAASESVPGLANIEGAATSLQAAVNTGIEASDTDSGTTAGAPGGRPPGPGPQFGGNSGGFAISPSS